MASYIPVKELNKRRDSFTEIKSICDGISHLKSGSSWVIIGYSHKYEFDSLTIFKEGLQWNILLQVLPSDEVCYVFVRVEFGKLPGACYVIIWTGEEVSEDKKLCVKENEKRIVNLFSNYEEVIYAHSQGNLNKQVSEHFKINRTRHGSFNAFKRMQKPSKKSPLDRSASAYSQTKKNRTSNFFISSPERNGSEPENKESGQVNEGKLKIGEIINIG